MSINKSRFALRLNSILARGCAVLVGLTCVVLCAIGWAQAPAAAAPASPATAPAKPAAAPAEPAAEEPDSPPEEPPAPKEVVRTYLSKNVVRFLQEDYFKDDRRDKTNDKDLQKKAADIRRLVDQVEKDPSGNMLKDPASLVIYERFYAEYFFAQLSLPPDPMKDQPNYAKERQTFFKRHVEIAKTPDVHTKLINMARTAMLEIAKGNYHPAARYNAMLMIGELNSKEAEKGGGSPTPPEPLIQALLDMLKELDNPDQIDAVRIACLVGILRHAEMDGQKQDLQQRWPPKGKMAVIDPMLALINTKEPPKGRSPEGHLWMQRRAIDILGAVGDVGTDGAVVKKLESIVGDEDAPRSIRCTAAVSLGRIMALPNAKVEPAEIAKKLGELAVLATRDELARLEAEQKQREDLLKPLTDEFNPMNRMPGMGGGRMPGMGGRMPGMTTPRMPSPRRGSGGSADMTMPGDSGPPRRPASAGPRGQLSGESSSRPPRSTSPARAYGGSSMMPRSMPGGGSYGMGGAGTEEDLAKEIETREKYKLDTACYRLKYQLSCVRTALEGVPARPKLSGLRDQYPDEPHQSFIVKLLTKVEELEKVVQKPEPQLKDLISDLRKGAGELDTIARGAPVTARPAEADPAEAPAEDGPEGPPVRRPAPRAAAPAR